QEYWDVMPGLRGDLFGPGDRAGYLAAKVEPTEVRATIHAHAEFEAFAATVRGIFAAWREANIEAMRSFDKGHHPTDLIHGLSEDLLARFREAPLVDAYDAYQHIMTYWSEMMQDDAYQITSEGWDVAKVIRELVKDADGKFTEEPDIVLGSGRGAKKLKAEVIPPALIVARYFAAEQAEVDELEAKAEELGRQLEELEEEHSGEDGLLVEAQTDAGKLTAASVKARLKAIKGDADAKEELAVLRQWSALSVEQGEATRAFKEAQAELNALVVKQYAKLPDSDAKALVVEDKWTSSLAATIEGELDSVAQGLTARIKTLTERYAAPLPLLNENVANLEA
ncbi:MAG: type I restriction endonuclease subunit M, partial [Pseudomonadota bacterium]|nr:type I restriction endonuclease subunit M [Pseudomonadota bacterium]